MFCKSWISLCGILQVNKDRIGLQKLSHITETQPHTKNIDHNSARRGISGVITGPTSVDHSVESESEVESSGSESEDSGSEDERDHDDGTRFVVCGAMCVSVFVFLCCVFIYVVCWIYCLILQQKQGSA